MPAHDWTESDDVAALYFALYREGVYSIETVAKRLGIGLDAMKMRISNHASLQTGKGLSNVSAQTRSVWSAWRKRPRAELERRIDEMLGADESEAAGGHGYLSSSAETIAVADQLAQVMRDRMEANIADLMTVVRIGQIDEFTEWFWADTVITLDQAIEQKRLHVRGLMLYQDDAHTVDRFECPGQDILGIAYGHVRTSPDSSAREFGDALLRRFEDNVTGKKRQIPPPHHYCALAIIAGTREVPDVTDSVREIEGTFQPISKTVSWAVTVNVTLGATTRKMPIFGFVLACGTPPLMT